MRRSNWLTTMLSGPGETGLKADDAARRVIRALGLAPATSVQAPTPPPGSETFEEACKRGKGLRSQGRYKEALAAFEQALALDPTYAPAWHGKGSALYNLNRPAEALAANEQALALDPTCAPAWHGKGNALWHLTRYVEALAAYEQALALDPTNRATWKNRINLLERLGRRSEAGKVRLQRDAALNTAH